VARHPQRSDRRYADNGQVAEGVELLAIGLDILDPGLDGPEAGKLVNDHAIGVGRLADVDPELLAVAQGDALAAVALHRPHDLGYDLAVVGLRVVDGGVNDHIDGHARCLLLGVCDALDHDLSKNGLFVANEFDGLDFYRLTFPIRDRQQVSDGFCRISGVKENINAPDLIFVW
jgi:hypothetical protein